MKYIVDIKGEIEGDYEIIGKYEERPTGHWIPARGTYYCSHCRHYAFESQMFDFCQDCGAKMINVRGLNNE